ncbi:MAG TPA: hypothetical protein VKZ49_15800 [Polyangiaceae bacterium]|nr:hypothetical protein [Polyangiaceae bacterium]
MPSILRYTLTALGIVLALGQASAAAPTATIDLNDQKQVIRGFGGINHPAWIGDLTLEQRDTAFGDGPEQIGMTVLRISSMRTAPTGAGNGFYRFMLDSAQNT